MKLLDLIFLISGWYSCIDGRRQQSNLSTDSIYFDDRPIPGTQSGIKRTTVVVHRSVEPQTTETDSYSQAAFGAQNQDQNYNAPFSVVPLAPNANPNNRVPSINLQPPTANTSPNYYGQSSPEKNNAINKHENLDPAQAIPTVSKTPQVTNGSLAVLNFGLNVLRSIDRRSTNLVVSPYSIAELLSLLQQGALGVTQQQISEALQMNPKTSLEAFQRINEHFKKRGNSPNILKVANNIYVADAFELNPAFKRLAIQSYDSDVTPMMFSRSQEAVAQINSWVAKKTNNKITELLTEDAVGENTQVVLVNAVYFKGLWAVKFKPDSTLPRDFHLNDLAKKKTPFMRIRKVFRTGTDPANNAQVVVLPFEDEQYSLMLVLPSEVSSLDALVSTLSAPQLASYNSFLPKEVDLEIPKFTARADTNLNPVLRKMGVTNAFGAQAELSNLGTFRTFSPQLSSALHTAMLSIDEEGGTASAATSFAVVALSYDDPSIIFKANRPFLAVLWDTESALPLFMARIQDPTP